MISLLLALALLAPPGVHYQGIQGTGVTASTTALAVDAEARTSAVAGYTVTGSITTTGANELLVVLIAHNHNGSGPQPNATGVTATGAGSLTFTKIVETSDYSTVQEGYASVWAAWAPTAGTYSVTGQWSANYASTDFISIVAYKGTKSCSSNVTTCFGATGFANDPGLVTVATSYALAGTTAGSMSVLSADDWNSYANRTTLLSNTVKIGSPDGDDGGGDTIMGWRTNNYSAGGTVTIGDSNTFSQRTWFAAAEILAGP